MNPDTALKIYMQTAIEIREHLAEIENALTDFVGPDDVTWAHVGSMLAVEAQLKEITDSLYQRGEYAVEVKA